MPASCAFRSERASRLVMRTCVIAVAVSAFLPRLVFGQQLPGGVGSDIEVPAILRPDAIDRYGRDFVQLPSALSDEPYYPPLLWPVDPPLGYSGPSGIVPREPQVSSHFVPMEDRWRIGFPEWDRHGQPLEPTTDVPYAAG